MTDFLLLSQYSKQQCVRDRNSSALLQWSAYVATEAIPASPDPEWARRRVLAENLPTNTAYYVDRTMSYFLQDPETINDVRLYMNQWNDPTTEDTLATNLQSVVNTFIPRFAVVEIPNARVAQWYTDNSIPMPPGFPPT